MKIISKFPCPCPLAESSFSTCRDRKRFSKICILITLVFSEEYAGIKVQFVAHTSYACTRLVTDTHTEYRNSVAHAHRALHVYRQWNVGKLLSQLCILQADLKIDGVLNMTITSTKSYQVSQLKMLISAL